MKRLLDALSRVWKLIRILFVLKTARDFMRDTSMMPSKG